MKLSRKYEINIPISNPIDFGGNIESNILNYLDVNYVGKCFHGALITGIIKILQRSDININLFNLTSSASMDVAFLAEVLIVSRGDLFVVEVQSMALHFTGSHINDNPKLSVSIIINKILSSLLVTGMFVPVEVEFVRHTPMSDILGISGILAPAKEFVIYNVKGRYTLQETHKYFIMMIKEQLKVRNELPPKLIEYFELLMYSYKITNTGSNGTTIFDQMYTSPSIYNDLLKSLIPLDFNEREISGVFSKPLYSYKSSPFIKEYPDLNIALKDEYNRGTLDISANDFISEMMRIILNNLRIINELATSYDTQEKIKSAAILWKYIMNQKI